MMRIEMNKNIPGFDFEQTKDKINDYFDDLEKLEWEQARLNVENGLIANYEVTPEDKDQPYISLRKDEFKLLARASKDKEVQKHLSGYYWAKSILSEQEQLYITEYFINGKYEDEVVDLLGLNDSNSKAFKKLKRRAIYKFAYALNLVV